MSKAKLKKELETFSGEQLIDLVLDVYGSSKEAKAYLEFFLNPDVDALLEKKKEAIIKELRRSKWNYSKARISRVKAEIKSVAAFGVGASYVGELMLYTIRALVMIEQYVNYNATLLNGTEKLVGEYLCLMYKAGELEKALAAVQTIVDDSSAGGNAFRKRIRYAADTALEALRPM